MITNRRVCKFFKAIVKHEKLMSGFWCKPVINWPNQPFNLVSTLIMFTKKPPSTPRYSSSYKKMLNQTLFYDENIVILFDKHKFVYFVFFFFFVRWLRCHCRVVIRTKQIQTIAVITSNVNLCTAAEEGSVIRSVRRNDFHCRCE